MGVTKIKIKEHPSLLNWYSALSTQCTLVKSGAVRSGKMQCMNSRIFTFFLNPDFVAGCPLVSNKQIKVTITKYSSSILCISQFQLRPAPHTYPGNFYSYGWEIPMDGGTEAGKCPAVGTKEEGKRPAQKHLLICGLLWNAPMISSTDVLSRPFATNDHMVHGGGQAHFYSRTGTSKQRQASLVQVSLF